MKKWLALLLCVVAPGLEAKEKLVDIHSVHPNIRVDIRYATPDNFTKGILYPLNRCLLQEDAAQALARAQDLLEQEGLGLKVWDCYRPLSIQKKLWAIVPDDRYVADPAKGSRHNRGAAVDVTLVDALGQELSMPTGYDDFSERAHRDFQDLPKTALANRAKLEETLKAQGFEGLPTEWWHFDGPNWKKHALRDDPLTNDFRWPERSRQALVVTAPSWDSIQGKMQRYERKGKKWIRAGEPWPVVLGPKGMAWGRGIHPEGLAPQKQESDGKSPAGIFALGLSYGYEPQPLEGSHWPYRSASPSLRCVDDSKSTHYNTIVDSASMVSDWTSSEAMRRNDALYEYLIIVEHNTAQIQLGSGSCIFLHVWRRSDSPTAGCTALERSHTEDLLRWLDPAAHPILVQLPEDDYKKHKKIWKLP